LLGGHEFTRLHLAKADMREWIKSDAVDDP